MIKIDGKYSSANVFSDTEDWKALSQIEELCSQEFTSGANIRIMPDYHYGAGCTIGFTANLGDKVVPNLVGVDIGCGVLAMHFPNNGKIDFAGFDDAQNGWPHRVRKDSQNQSGAHYHAHRQGRSV